MFEAAVTPSRSRRWVAAVAVLVLSAAGLATLSSAGAAETTCTPGKEIKTDDATFTRAICSVKAKSPFYAEQDAKSDKIGRTYKTKTWFACAVTKEDTDEVWLKGLVSPGGKGEGTWGWMPAKYLVGSDGSMPTGIQSCDEDNIGIDGDDVWAKLAKCESGGKADINTGNGYYGAFQFSASTWKSVGGPGLPNEQPYAVQKKFAKKLQERSGWGQWPACSKKIGVR